MLAIFDPVALEVMTIYFPAYERIHSEIHVRITELPASATLRDLRNAQLNALVRVSGVVTRRSGVFPQLKYVKFDCNKCGGVLGPFYQDTTKEVKVSFCPNCSSRGPFSVNSEQVGACLGCINVGFNDIVDCIQELPENDTTGIAWFSSCWTTPPSSRGHSIVGSYRLGQARRRNCMHTPVFVDPI